MKHLCFLFWVITFFLAPIQAQQVGLSISYGYDTYPVAVQVLPNGNWLVLGQGLRNSTATRDTIFALVIKPNGLVEKRAVLSLPPSEVYHFSEALVLPDGGFMIAVDLGLCDASQNRYVVQRYNADLQLVWRVLPDNANSLPARWRLLPNGLVLGCNSTAYFWVVDPATGAVLNRIGSINAATFVDFALTPDGKRLLTTGSSLCVLDFLPDFQTAQQVTSSCISAPNPFSFEYFIRFSNNPNYGYNQNALIKVSGTSIVKLQTYPFTIRDLVTDGKFLYLLTAHLNHTYLIRADGQGEIIDTLMVTDKWLSGMKIGVGDTGISVTGVNTSGSTRKSANALWVRTIFGGLPPVRVDNATVSGIETGSKLTVKGTPTAWNPNLYYYTLSGGDFRVQVSNLGSSVLRSVDVLTGFKGGDCGLHPAYRKRYRHINILPGDSEWLHFGDLNAIGLQKDMEQVCFWVSSPNEKPDWVEAADTTFCYGVPVNATEATTNQLDVFPSLATESVWVSGAPEGYDTWRLFNVQGHLASTGKYGVAPTPFMVAVDELPPGVYLLWIGNHKKKIVVVH